MVVQQSFHTLGAAVVACLVQRCPACMVYVINKPETEAQTMLTQNESQMKWGSNVNHSLEYPPVVHLTKQPVKHSLGSGLKWIYTPQFQNFNFFSLFVCVCLFVLHVVKYFYIAIMHAKVKFKACTIMISTFIHLLLIHTSFCFGLVMLLLSSYWLQDVLSLDVSINQHMLG